MCSKSESSPAFRYVAVVMTWRIVGMLLLTFLLPLLATISQALGNPPGFGATIMGYTAGIIAAFFYLILATAAHFLVWRRSLRVKCWTELAVLAACALGLLLSNLRMI